MSITPEDSALCRKQATRCAVLAAKADDPKKKAAFLTLSKQWETLAVELEKMDEDEIKSADSQAA